MQQQNNRPVSKNGFKFFIFGLLVAFLIGHFFKFYFNSNRLTQFFENKLIEQNLNFEFKISGIDYVLADGLWPTFGFYIEDLIVTSDDVCKLPLQIVLKDSLVKIKTLKSIWTQKIQLSSTQVGSARILHSRALCESQYKKNNVNDKGLEAWLYDADKSLSREIAKDSALEVQRRQKNIKAKVSNFSKKLKKQLSIFFERNENYLNNWPEIYVDEIFYIKDGQNIVLQNFSLDSEEKQLNIQADLNFSFSKTELQGLPKLNLKFHISKPQLQTIVFTRYKEGRIQTKLDLDWLTSNYQLQTNIYDLPLHSLLGWLKQQQLYKSNWQPDLLWLSCTVNSEGQLLNPSKMDLVFEPCVADAEKGQFEFKNLKLDPFHWQEFSPFMVNVENIPIQSFLNSLDKSGPYNIFSEFGVLSGDVTVKALDQIDANWTVTKLEALFSKNGVNAFQKIDRLDVKMSYEKQRLSGLIDNVKFDSGDFEGEFSYNFDPTFKEGMLQFNIKKMQLNSGVQSLLVGKTISGVSLYGQARIVDSVLQKWRGSLGAKAVSSSVADMNAIKVDFDYFAPKLKAELKIDDMTLTPKHTYYDLVSSLSLTFNVENQLQIKNLKSQINSIPGQGKWNALQANLFNGEKRFVIRSAGSWFDDSFTGTVSVVDNLKQSWEWLLLGTLGELYLAPSTELIEQVQGSKLKGYTLPKEKFQKGMSETEFKDIDFKKSSPLEQLKSLGVNFINSAKEIIPEQNQNK